MGNELKKVDGLELKSFDQLFDLSDRLSKAGHLLPGCYKEKPGAVLATILKGRELGFSTMASFSALFVITVGGDSKIGIYADAMLALLGNRGYKYEWVTTNGDEATIKLSYPGKKDFELSYTMAQAASAKLSTKDIWVRYPDAMLRARATSAAARAYAPEVVHGIYTKEELDDMQPQEKVIEVKANPTSGAETLITALKALPEVEADEPEVILEVSDGDVEVACASDTVRSYQFESLYSKIKKVSTRADLSKCAALVGACDALSEEEKTILRGAYASKKADMEAKDDE